MPNRAPPSAVSTSASIVVTSVSSRPWSTARTASLTALTTASGSPCVRTTM